jgi:Tol biopolymer transport system component/DNA-binding winged helix-turn-helix (wHTH) protein
VDETLGTGQARVLRFGEFTLDLRRRALLRGTQRLRLTARPLEVLVLLAGARGRVVDKKELLDTVWRETFVTEDVLVQAVRELRRVLGDDKDDPRFIQTVPRLGYRFVAEVSEGGEEGGQARAAAAAAAPSVRARRAWVWGAAAGLGAALAFVLLRGGGIRSPSPSPPPSLRQLTFGIRSAVKPAYSPDGRLLLYVSEDEATPGVLDVFVMPAEGGTPWRITDHADARGDMPVFTADGTSVVFSRYRGGEEGSRRPDLWTVPAFGGAPRVLIPDASGAGLSPDGARVAYTKHLPDRRALWVSPLSDLEAHVEVAPLGFVPRFSPDGRRLAYTTSYPEGGEGRIFVADTTTWQSRALTETPEQLYGLGFTPDGRFLVFASGRSGPFHLWRVPAEGGHAAPLTVGVGEYLSPWVSPDGGTLVFSHLRPARDLHVVRGLAAEEERQLTRDQYHYWPCLSPSGRLLASVSRQPDFRQHLYVIGLQDGRSLEVGNGPARFPSWVDEDRLAFLRETEDGAATEVRLVTLGRATTVKVASFKGRAEWLAVEPSLSRLAVVLAPAAGPRHVILRDLRTGTDRVVAEGGEYEGLRFAPDGTRLAWSGPPRAAGPGVNGVWLLEAGASAPRQVVADGFRPAWSADGRCLYYVRAAGPSQVSGLWQVDLDSGGTVMVRPWTTVVQDFDVRGDVLVFAPGETAPGSIYAMTLAPP